MHGLSGGERQRVAIARAIAVRPAFLVCDEITSALDVSVQAVIVTLLDDLRQRFGLGLVFVTHDLGLVNTIADEVLVLKDGITVEYGSGTRCLERPRANTARLCCVTHLTLMFLVETNSKYRGPEEARRWLGH